MDDVPDTNVVRTMSSHTPLPFAQHNLLRYMGRVYAVNVTLVEVNKLLIYRKPLNLKIKISLFFKFTSA